MKIKPTKARRAGLPWLEEYDGTYHYLWKPLRKGHWRVGFHSTNGVDWESVGDVFNDSEGINPRIVYPKALYTDLSEDEVVFRLL